MIVSISQEQLPRHVLTIGQRLDFLFDGTASVGFIGEFVIMFQEEMIDRVYL